ncbi:HEAT repeat domain-containing protein [Kitasatospora purpeofusca]|uniref:HEAT repeat domain-containing protein n=1 Tax=Kitasatospora purpeofusca TaxID=67352 RepID=UPI0035DAF00C
MINEHLEDVDWSSMGHAYGSAEEVPLWLERMASPDPEVRDEAFTSFYGAAHHQGGVYRCTTASIPFLFALADDDGTPDRAAVLGLLMSIGRAALDCDPEGIYCSAYGDMSTPYAETVPRMREHAADFERYAADPDPQVRRAAVPALGLFVDDTDRAFALLRERLAAESGTAERLLAVETAAALARRLRSARSRPGSPPWPRTRPWTPTSASPPSSTKPPAHRRRSAPTSSRPPPACSASSHPNPRTNRTRSRPPADSAPPAPRPPPNRHRTRRSRRSSPPSSPTSTATAAPTPPPPHSSPPSTKSWTIAPPSAPPCSPPNSPTRTGPPATTPSPWPRT